MSQSATPATQNGMTTCLETFEKERFCGFPHRHGEATGKPETRDETGGSTKTSISYETSGNFHSWQHDKRTSFAASPIDTARPRENQTRVKICNLKIDASCEASVNFQHMSENATPAREFAPCHHLTQPCQCDLQKTRNATRLKCCACHEK